MTFPHTTRRCVGCRQDKPAHRVHPRTGYCAVCAEIGVPATSRPLPAAPARITGRWPHDALRIPAALDRLARAGAELAEVRAELANDTRRAFQAAARREQERAQRLEGQAINYQLAIDAPDELELVSAAPGLYREYRRARVEP